MCYLSIMFDKLRDLLNGPEPQSADNREVLTAEEARVALAAIMIEAAHADGLYECSERDTIDRVLAARYGISSVEAADIRHQGERFQAEAADVVRFTRAIKQAVPHEDRVAVVEALWEVVYADGEREAHESALMRKVAGLLYVPDREVGLARRRVANRLGIEG